MSRLWRDQIPAPWTICGSNGKQIHRGVPEIRDLGYFKRINGLRFWCLQKPLKIATFWHRRNFAKSCPASFAAVKKFRVRNNEHVAPSVLLHISWLSFHITYPKFCQWGVCLRWWWACWMIERIPDLRHHFLGHIAGLKDQLYRSDVGEWSGMNWRRMGSFDGRLIGW